MASVALRLLNTVLYGGPSTYRQLIRSGFRPEWLHDIELRRTWDIVVNHIGEHKITPSKTYIQERMPAFQYLDSDQIDQESPQALSQLLREQHIQMKMFDILEKGHRLNHATPLEAAQYLHESVAELARSSAPVDVVDLTESIEDVMIEYDNASTMAAHGLQIPWKGLHNETLGMHPEEFILVFGRPKSMKTFVALYMAAHAYLYSHARVLIVSRELSKEMIRRRLVAIIAEVAYGPWRKGRLSESGRHQVYSALMKLVQMEAEQFSPRNVSLPPAIRIASGYSKQYSGLELVSALADEFEPDLILDDGLYLAAASMKGSDPLDWRTMTSLTQGCKRIAGENKVVYLATTQANRATTKKDKVDQLADLEGFSYADSYAQDCSLALRVMKQKEDRVRKRPQYILIGLPGYREGNMDAFAIHAQPCTNFNEFSSDDYEEFDIDERLVHRAVKEDDALINVPAGPSISCDRYEREIPGNMSEARAIKPTSTEKTPKKRRVRSLRRNPKEK